VTTALSNLDIIIFFGSLVIVMILGLRFGGHDKTAQDYFLAGNKTRWWGVAGSIFGSNISANHIVGMLGVGYSIGFAQSHFEVGAIAGLLLLCYGFLPVYKSLKIYTLSEYLARRYDEKTRMIYALIMIFVIVFVMMVPGFYIGSRSLNILFSGDYKHVEYGNYVIGIVIMVVITGSYTIFGGLKAVIVTDVFQSFLLLVATGIVAYVTFSQPEIGGWFNMLEIDANNKALMHLYLPSDHPDLPWTGVLSGLFILHFYYWGANQFIVQRALSASSMREARFGIILAGFVKLLIPFISIGTGIAAFYLFQRKGLEVDQDAAFTTLITEFVQPLGYGLLGLVAAGLIGAILSSLDSMMNSAATIITFDIYKKHLRPEADERTLILIGKIWIAILIVGAAIITILIMDPNSEDSFFLHIARHQANLVSGIVVIFGLGMFWKRASARGAFWAVLSGIICSYGLPVFYRVFLRDYFNLEAELGLELNFLHTVLIACLVAAVAQIVLSVNQPIHPEASKLTWIGVGAHDPKCLIQFGIQMLSSMMVLIALAYAMVFGWISNAFAGTIASVWIASLFIGNALVSQQDQDKVKLWQDDRVYGGALAALAVFILFYYF